MRRHSNACTIIYAQGVDVPFEKFEETYIHERDKLFAAADLKYEEPHFNARVAATLKTLGYDYGVSSPTVAAATCEFCEEFMKYVVIDAEAEDHPKNA